MSDTELRKQIDDLDKEFAAPEPAVESQEDLLARLEDLDVVPEPVESNEDLLARLNALEDSVKESVIEVETKEAPTESPTDWAVEETPQTGRVILRYDRALIKRNLQGLITEIIEAKSRKYIERDVYGTVIAVTEVTEMEEVEAKAVETKAVEESEEEPEVT